MTRQEDRKETAAEQRPSAPASVDALERSGERMSCDAARRFASAHAGTEGLGVPSLVWGPGQARRVRLIEEQIPLRGRRILDVGCGVGEYVRHFGTMTATTYGIDVERARVAQGSGEVAGLLVGSAEALPFADGSFDVVVLNEVIEHVGDDRRTLAEAARIVPVGGHVVIYAPNRGFPFETHGVRWRGSYRFGNFPLVNYLPRSWRDRLVPHARVYSGGDMHRLVRGLPLKTVVQSVVYPAFDGIRARHERVGRTLQATLHRAERTPLRVLGLSHFVILERVAGEVSV